MCYQVLDGGVYLLHCSEPESQVPNGAADIHGAIVILM